VHVSRLIKGTIDGKVDSPFQPLKKRDKNSAEYVKSLKEWIDVRNSMPAAKVRAI